MGLTIKLESESGEVSNTIIDRQDILASVLPSYYDESYVCLRFIDPYGDTVFNRLQMEMFLAEWNGLYDNSLPATTTGILDRVRELAEFCRDNPHFYLKFYGD